MLLPMQGPELKGVGKPHGFKQPSGNLNKATAAQDKTLIQQAFELRSAEVKMKAPAQQGGGQAPSTPAMLSSLLPSVQASDSVMRVGHCAVC